MASLPASSAQTRTEPRAALARLVFVLLRVGMAVVYVVAGLAKLTGMPSMVTLFAAIGAGQWLRYVVGSLELLGGLALLAAPLAGAAALGLAMLMIGATLTEVFVDRRLPFASLASFAALLLIAWYARHHTRQLLARLRRD